MKVEYFKNISVICDVEFNLFQGAVHKRWVNLLPTFITAGLADTLLISLGVLGVSAAAFQITWFRYT